MRAHRFSLFLLLPLLLLSARSAAAQARAALPVNVDTVTLLVNTPEAKTKLVVSLLPGFLRVDLPDEGYSVVYNQATQHYLGLEHRNYTFWEFSWPEVQNAIQASSRYELRMNDLTSDGLASYSLSSGTNFAPALADAPTYLWKTTDQKKLVAGFTASQWIGTNSIGDQVEAWCVPAPSPKFQQALAQLRTINEPMALVPVRTLIPPLIYPLMDSLARGGVVPLELSWGTADTRTNHFSLVQIKTVQPKGDPIAVPKNYLATTLVTMDGITNTNAPPSTNPLPNNPPVIAPSPSLRGQ